MYKNHIFLMPEKLKIKLKSDILLYLAENLYFYFTIIKIGTKYFCQKMIYLKFYAFTEKAIVSQLQT